MVGHSGCSSFPVYPSGTTCPSSNIDLYIAKFSSDGAQQYSNLISGASSGHTTLGQNRDDLGNAIIDNDAGITPKREGDILCDANDNLFIYGLAGTSYFSMTFPTPPTSAYSQTSSSTQPCFILEFSSTHTLIWGTYFGGLTGGSYVQFAGGMALDDNSNLYICGTTSAGWTSSPPQVDFPIQYETGATNVSIFNGGVNPYPMFVMEDAFVAKFNLLGYGAGVNNIIGANSLIVCYPNPSNGMFMLNMSKFDNASKRINVYDQYGQLTYNTQTSESEIQLMIPDLASGLYFVEVSDNNRRDVVKIIIDNK
jgi:Secretion system C-terminal sorting domain/Beta-propeller repeat